MAVSNELKELRKQAKKLGIDFDAATPEGELKMLVDAAEAASAAQKEEGAKAAATPEGVQSEKPDTSSEKPEVKDEKPQDPPSANVEPEEPVQDEAGDNVIKTYTSRNGSKFILVDNTDGEEKDIFIKNQAGVKIGRFESVDDGNRYLENLSRLS